MSDLDGATGMEWLQAYKAQLVTGLLSYLPKCRWFGGKARELLAVSIIEMFPLVHQNGKAAVVIVRVSFTTGEPEIYALPIAEVTAADATIATKSYANAIILNEHSTTAASLIDAFAHPIFCLELLATIGAVRRVVGSYGGELISSRPENNESWETWRQNDLTPSISTAEQSNTSVRYGSKLILKLIRRLDPGQNPELEFGQHFSRQSQFRAYAPFHGALEYRTPQGITYTVAILQGMVANQGDAWQYTLSEIAHYFTRVPLDSTPPKITTSLCEAAQQPTSAPMQKWLDAFLPAVELLGRHTGEMHLALSVETQDANFTPEPFTLEYQRTLFQDMQSFQTRMLALLEQRLPLLPIQWQPFAEKLLAAREALSGRLEMLQHVPLQAQRIRCHGDFHLGQVLFTGNDFVIIDFEGPPMLSIIERRVKRSALCDVAGMVRSFHYAALTGAAACPQQAKNPLVSEWANLWYHATSAAFLRSYLDVTRGASFLPTTQATFQQTFELYLLDKAIYELGYELNHRPDWVGVPLRGILDILQSATVSPQ